MPDTGCCATGDCHAATVLRVLGSELKLITMHSLMANGRRFNELRELTGICQSSLARTLRELEDLGLAERVVHTQGPVAVDYRLTAMGRDLAAVIQAFEQWSHQWLTELQTHIRIQLA
ncbi:MAG TPA: helix-turn-helix domain-containing protein [Thermoplasmata archaeon]|jgi:DNA-binding HxlR family transcriptional regulator|nr:helix-turn-helix domain-containing protein [Thermoplasmata archaeon]